MHSHSLAARLQDPGIDHPVSGPQHESKAYRQHQEETLCTVGREVNIFINTSIRIRVNNNIDTSKPDAKWQECLPICDGQASHWCVWHKLLCTNGHAQPSKVTKLSPAPAILGAAEVCMRHVLSYEAVCRDLKCRCWLLIICSALVIARLAPCMIKRWELDPIFFSI